MYFCIYRAGSYLPEEHEQIDRMPDQEKRKANFFKRQELAEENSKYHNGSSDKCKYDLRLLWCKILLTLRFESLIGMSYIVN